MNGGCTYLQLHDLSLGLLMRRALCRHRLRTLLAVARELAERVASTLLLRYLTQQTVTLRCQHRKLTPRLLRRSLAFLHLHAALLQRGVLRLQRGAGFAFEARLCGRDVREHPLLDPNFAAQILVRLALRCMRHTSRTGDPQFSQREESTRM